MRRWHVLLAGLLVALCCTSARAQQVLTFTPFHANGIYQSGERVGWTVTRPAGAAGPTRFAYEIKKNEFDVLKSGMLDLSPGRATIEIVVDEPSMIYVWLTPEGEQPPPADAPQRKPYVSVGAAIAPDRLQPSVPRPADFDDFWAAKRNAQRKLPMNAVLTPVASNVPGVEVSTVKVDSLGSHMQAYVAKPQREGRFPALVIYQGAGVRALRPDTGAARAAEGWLVLDVDAHDKAPDAPTGPPFNYQTIGNTDREQSYFLNMYLRDTRAIDYVATRSDWDGKTLVILGTSQGGQQGIVTAGLNPDRITALLVNEPSGGDTNGELHGRRAAYPNWPAEDPKAMQTALYFDTVNFASRVKAPTLASMGFIDRVVPPVGVWIAINQIPGPKEALPMIEANHVHLTPDKVGAFAQRSTEVLRGLLAGAEYKPSQLPASALAQATQGVAPSAPPPGVVGDACPPPLQVPPELAAIRNGPNRAALLASPPPAVVAYNEEQARRARNDWGNLCRYRDDNVARVAAKAPAPTAVFMGDSITEGWARTSAGFFTAHNYVGRGISGQVTGQNLLRFQQDVINLHPKVVHIMIGTNDVAGNAGPTTYENIQNNLMAMVQMARGNKIAVVLATIPPSTDFPWRRGMEPALKIMKMNEWIREYARREGLVLADYHKALANAENGFRMEWTGDGVHPNPEGFKMMNPIAEEAIAIALKKNR